MEDAHKQVVRDALGGSVENWGSKWYFQLATHGLAFLLGMALERYRLEYRFEERITKL